MLKLKKLHIEYRSNPIGLDCNRPGFSWVLESDANGVMQEAYRISVNHEGETIWDTGRVLSDQSIHVLYSGAALRPQAIYSVEVTVWDNYNSKAGISGTFETGMLNSSNFTGRWITAPAEAAEANPVFKKTFSAKKGIRAARIYASALGLYEIALNGERVGEDYFTPGWTNYHKRIQYQTYDVTDCLKTSNQLEITAANGWYKGIFGFINQSNHYGDRIAVLLELHIWYHDGSKEVVATDESWGYTTGCIRSSEIYLGETIDTTFVQPECIPAALFDTDHARLAAQESEPVRITQRIKAVNFFRTPKGEAVLDFGQNLAGFVEIAANGVCGQRITVRHAEVLDKEGNLYTENLRGAKSVDTYVLNGNKQVLAPHFTFHGFRYIAVEGLGDVLNPEDFTACALHTDMEQTGSFTCSHPLLNRLQLNIEWGQRSNFLDIPTDCPQRDERLGWTGDAQAFCSTAAFNFNTALFFRKWLKDLASEQTEEYGVPHTVPNILGSQAGAAFWGDCAVIIPWEIYQAYGDVRILQDQYESMKNWVEYIRARETSEHLWQSGFQYGDWLALDKEEGESRTGMTDVYLIATACYAYSTLLLSKAAGVLGRAKDRDEYLRLHEQIAEGFNAEYITQKGRMVSETQTACILALHYSLAKGKYRERILESLITNLKNHKNHLTTGFVGTPYLCHTLSENGCHDIAGAVLLQEDYPSWLYAVKMGATTIWERWNSMKPDGSFDESGMNSFNHYTYGAIGNFIYEKLAGIQKGKPGYKHSVLAPAFISGITEAQASLETPYGRLSIAWACKDGKITMDVIVPANTTASLHLPEREGCIELGSGAYHYCYPTDTCLKKERFSMGSTLGQLLAEPMALALFERIMPGMTTNPMIRFAHGMTINEMAAHMPEGGEAMFKKVIDALNEQQTDNP